MDKESALGKAQIIRSTLKRLNANLLTNSGVNLKVNESKAFSLLFRMLSLKELVECLMKSDVGYGILKDDETEFDYRTTTPNMRNIGID